MRQTKIYMASGVFAVLDDIASLMDDVAVVSKVAAKKTAGILGDDLAVNAEKATGFLSSRELPVLWAITKGSFVNKIIIIPIVLLLNAFLPVAIKFALIGGGFYLAYEGVEKIIHYLFHRKDNHETVLEEKSASDASTEKAKVRSAIITDFILSVEIVIIALSTVLDKSGATQAVTVSLIALLATVGVYGIVALIVRMDDIGYRIIRRTGEDSVVGKLGGMMVKALPVIIKILSVVGTIALILVSGGIFVHQVDYFHHLIPDLPVVIKEVALGLVAGLITYLVIVAGRKMIAYFKN